jgi:mono/diheme cytochrome c family protein
MRRLDLVVTSFSILALAAGCGSSSSSSSKDSSTAVDEGVTADVATTADTAAPTEAGTPDGGTTADANLGGDDGGAADVATAGDGTTAGDGGTVMITRGQYLVGVLGCNGCHTPKTMAGAPDTTKTLSGIDCFVSMGGCLSSANLTPDMDTGIGGFSDQAIIDAFRAGKDPDPMAAGKYLFARMPYYQFAPLSDDDAHAIVAYLRSLPAIKHAVMDAAGSFAMPPTSPEWTPVDPTKLPAPGAGAPADAANGKYFASILCVNCHSPAPTGMPPKHVDETTAFQGGQSSTLNAGDAGMIMFDSANLTPDMTGIKDWMVTDLVKAIKMAKDPMGKTLCSPMRANASITDADATAIADYLKSIPPVAHAVTACSARM